MSVVMFMVANLGLMLVAAVCNADSASPHPPPPPSCNAHRVQALHLGLHWVYTHNITDLKSRPSVILCLP